MLARFTNGNGVRKVPVSHNLFNIRVYYSGFEGLIKTPAVVRHTSLPPSIPGLPRLQEIDYAPEVSCAYLQPYQDAHREMTREEIQCVEKWLNEVSQGRA